MAEKIRESTPRDVCAIRRFTRFYTSHMGVLNQRLFGTDFSVTEARVLMEIAEADQIRASEIAIRLNLDPAYLSRILKRFEARGQIERRPDPKDQRGRCLALTGFGQQTFADLVTRSNADVTVKIDHLSRQQRGHLVAHLEQAKSLLTSDAISHSDVIMREAECGDLGWIIHRQSQYYRDTYGWDETFEHVVIEVLAEYLKTACQGLGRGWIAERNDEIIGSVFLQHGHENLAKLRLLFVEPSARGIGLGGTLVDLCINQARMDGYAKINLWTMNKLTAAKDIYETRGFVLTQETPVRQFNQDLVSLTYTLDLHQLSDTH